MDPKVFVSFDYDNDKHYKYLLEAWHAHPRFQFVFDDATPEEINSYNVGRIKAALTTKIKNATHILVIVGKYANTPHRKRELIGYKNWINFEIHQAIEFGKQIAVVMIDDSHELPDELKDVSTAVASSFSESEIITALRQAPAAYKNPSARRFF